MKQKQKNKTENILGFFPFMFFVTGMMIVEFANVFKGIVSWLIVFMGLEIYLLTVIWFNYEVNKLI